MEEDFEFLDTENEVIPEPDDSHGVIDTISTILSWIMVPLLMPVYGLVMIFNFSLLDYIPTISKWIFGFIVAGVNLVLPMVVYFILFKTGRVKDIGLNHREDRWIPYLLTIICLLFTGWFLWFRGAPLWVAMFYAGGAAGAVINMIVNRWWKISAHAAGSAGLIALLVRLAYMGFSPHPILFWLIGWVILTGLLGSARIWLGRHTLGQVLAGYAVGFIAVFFMMMIQ